MRSSISAQSWLSVPPAPALMERMALAGSCSPPSSFWNSASSTRAASESSDAARSPSTFSPASAHSMSTRVSSSRLRSFCSVPRSRSTRFLRLSAACAASCWFQKSGAVIRSSSWPSSFVSAAPSKIAADVRGPRDEVIVFLLQVVQRGLRTHCKGRPAARGPANEARSAAAKSPPHVHARTSPWRV